MNKTAETSGLWIRRKWKKLLLILLVVLVAYWFLIDPNHVTMEIHTQVLSDVIGVGRITPKVQVSPTLFPGSSGPQVAYMSAADLPQVNITNDATTLRLNFGWLAPHKVEVRAFAVPETELHRSIASYLSDDLYLESVSHTYSLGLLEIQPSVAEAPRQVLTVYATWYGILGPKAALYAVTLNGTSAAA